MHARIPPLIPVSSATRIVPSQSGWGNLTGPTGGRGKLRVGPAPALIFPGRPAGGPGSLQAGPKNFRVSRPGKSHQISRQDARRPRGRSRAAGPCLALKGARGAQSGRQGVVALPAKKGVAARGGGRGYRRARRGPDKSYRISRPAAPCLALKGVRGAKGGPLGVRALPALVCRNFRQNGVRGASGRRGAELGGNARG